jgi:hypothetical protein
MYRVRTGLFKSEDDAGNNGMFIVPSYTFSTAHMTVIASDGEGWEHVSVSRQDRCPNWGEMCRIKNMFWDEEDTVVQFHPAKSEYVSNHEFCLHLWRQAGKEFPRPPSILVGIK